MAIAQTGAIYKSLNFDGKSSREYGVYITGAAVYNAPERAVEMISIPGRNGAFALDQGRFENITVTYPAGIFADNETDFAEAISDFRNYLCSRSGYCRLTDEYNPDEYRLAVYKSGLEVEPALLRAGEFNITFECKPQRYLASGETAVAVANNGTITNPTMFDANPILEVIGYGSIVLNGYDISVSNSPIGYIDFGSNIWLFAQHQAGISVLNYFANGDTISAGECSFDAKISLPNWSAIDGIYNVVGGTVSYSGNIISIKGTTQSGTGVYGTTGTISSQNVTFAVEVNGNRENMRVSLYSMLNNAGHDFVVGATWYDEGATPGYTGFSLNPRYESCRTIVSYLYGTSTKATVGETIYIDCYSGEAYIVISGTTISNNNNVSLMAELPKLAPGSNSITYSNTFSSVKITPKWWKI